MKPPTQDLIASLSKTGNLLESCRLLGCNFRDVYEWARDEPELQKALDSIKKDKRVTVSFDPEVVAKIKRVWPKSIAAFIREAVDEKLKDLEEVWYGF